MVRRVGLLIAHPDDEVMFFLPWIMAQKKLRNEVYLLCLTRGDWVDSLSLYDGNERIQCQS